jgi:hypothetical protein
VLDWVDGEAVMAREGLVTHNSMMSFRFGRSFHLLFAGAHIQYSQELRTIVTYFVWDKVSSFPSRQLRDSGLRHLLAGRINLAEIKCKIK